MTINDSSSLILIVGAIAILAFVVHGLWFSGRSINRKLVKGSKEDQEIVKSNQIGKVRIVVPQDNKDNTATAEIGKIETFSSKEPKAQAVKEHKDPKEALNEQIMTTYELNLSASTGRPYKGLDLEELFNTYGFIHGEKDIFCVSDTPNLKHLLLLSICCL